MRLSGMAPQLTATRGFFALGEASWSEATASSLPVPLSPVMSTVQVERATRSSVASAARMLGCRPTMVPRLVALSAVSETTGVSPHSDRASLTSAADPRCCIHNLPVLAEYNCPAAHLPPPTVKDADLNYWISGK